jgi:hypothetical protein
MPLPSASFRIGRLWEIRYPKYEITNLTRCE